MSKPTIDDMIVWLATLFQEMPAQKQSDGALIWQGIHSILEQHRDWEPINSVLGHTMIDPKKALADIQLKAIRAFVERVEKRIFETRDVFICLPAMKAELAAMEKENAEND